MDYDPPHGPGARGCSAHGCPSAHRKATMAAPGRKLVITSLGGSDAGGAAEGSGGVRPEEA